MVWVKALAVVAFVALIAGAGAVVGRKYWPPPDSKKSPDVPAEALSCKNTPPRVLNYGKAVTWGGLGDSYSAGVGGPLFSQAWGQDEFNSFEVAAQARFTDKSQLRVQFSWSACGGAVAADIVGELKGDDVRAAADHNGDHDQQWWNTAPQPLRAARGALITSLTLGGNDVGFGDLPFDCMWRQCDRIADGGPAGDDLAPGQSPDARWKAAEDRLVNAYEVIRYSQPRRGYMFVLDYPIPFADPTRASITCPADLAIGNQDLIRLNGFAGRLDSVIAAAVQRANAEIDAAGERSGNITLVPWHTPDGGPAPTVNATLAGRQVTIPFNPQGICGTNQMLLDFGPRTPYREDGDSFHPSNEGVRIGGCRLADAVQQTVLGPMGFNENRRHCDAPLP